MFISHELTLPRCHIIFLAFSYLFEEILSMQKLDLDIFCDSHFPHLDISDIMIQIILSIMIQIILVCARAMVEDVEISILST